MHAASGAGRVRNIRPREAARMRELQARDTDRRPRSARIARDAPTTSSSRSAAIDACVAGVSSS